MVFWTSDDNYGNEFVKSTHKWKWIGKCERHNTSEMDQVGE